MRSKKREKPKKPRYFVICKPAGMLSQFTSDQGKQTLADLADFPSDVYPVGRLDELSEGLLILTNDTYLNHHLLDPAYGHQRRYWVCVSGQITEEALEELRQGVTVKVKNKQPYHTRPAQAERMPPPEFPERVVSFSYSQERGLSWICLTLTEGKNRQVRKMTAAVGFPTLRLIRVGIESLPLDNMVPGDVVEWERDALYGKLHIAPPS